MEKWSEEESSILKQNMDNSLTLLKNLLPHRSEDEIIEKIRLLYRKQLNNRWTEEELNILRENVYTNIFKLLPLLPNRTFTSINYKRYTMNLREERLKNAWSEEELKRLSDLKDEGYTNFEISQMLGRPLNSVMGKLYNSGKVFKRYSRDSRKAWSEKDVQYVLNSIENKVSVEEMAKKLNTTTSKVIQKAIHLGFKHRDITSEDKKARTREKQLRLENTQLKRELSSRENLSTKYKELKLENNKLKRSLSLKVRLINKIEDKIVLASQGIQDA